MNSTVKYIDKQPPEAHSTELKSDIKHKTIFLRSDSWKSHLCLSHNINIIYFWVAQLRSLQKQLRGGPVMYAKNMSSQGFLGPGPLSAVCYTL